MECSTKIDFTGTAQFSLQGGMISERKEVM
jgi:hypothetical protein